MEHFKLADLMDHTLLKPEATEPQIDRLCFEAQEYKFATVCINPFYVKRSADILVNSKISVCTVVGFPLGANRTSTKVSEVILAIKEGATEFDMVMNIGALKGGHEKIVDQEIQEVVKAAQGCIVKVILETCLLTDDEKVRACQLAQQAGAHFVKTSTGFSTGGATVKDVALLRQTVGSSMGVKASGGIKTYAIAQAMIEAGANRLGTSSGIAILNERLTATTQ